MFASSRKVGALLVLLLLASCAGEDVIELSLRTGPNGTPSGFACEVAGQAVLREPLLAGNVVLVFDVIRFDGDPPLTNRLFDIRESCEDERRPCRVNQRVCVALDDPRRGETTQDYVIRRLIEATEMLEIDDLDVAMFRLVATTQVNACERDEVGYQALLTAGNEVLGCAYTEVVPLHGVGVSRHYFALDHPTDTCDPEDLVTCATVLGL